MKKFLCIIISALICFGVAMIAEYFQKESIMTWYPHLHKSVLNPPNIVFPIAWSILYLCMSVSIGLIYGSDNPRKDFFLSIFVVQLLLNCAWSISFFYLQSPLLGLINILLLEFVLIYYAIRTYPTARASSILFFPYILWVGFATYLNVYIWWHN